MVLYNIDFKDLEELKDLDALIIATAHECFHKYTKDKFNNMFRNSKIIIDVKGILNRKSYEDAGYTYWRL